MTLELVVGDLHDRMGVYKNVGTVLTETAKKGKKAERAFFTGDFSDKIDDRFVTEQLGRMQFTEETAKLVLQDAQEAMKIIKALNGKAQKTAEETKAHEEAVQVMQAAQVISQIYGAEAARRYQPHEKAAAELTKKHGIKFYGVAGNHDNGFIYKIIKSCELLEQRQPLLEEGIAGCNHSIETHEAFAGPGFAFMLPMDDHDEPAKSPIYNFLKDRKVSLVVAHKEADKPGDIAPSGTGLAEIVKKNRAVQYAGHFHNAEIRRDEKTGALVINPGCTHIFVCDRQGNKIKNVDIYRLDDATRKAMPQPDGIAQAA
jgi:Icc-related predicted phosphoesterase